VVRCGRSVVGLFVTQYRKCGDPRQIRGKDFKTLSSSYIGQVAVSQGESPSAFACDLAFRFSCPLLRLAMNWIDIWIVA